MRTFKDSNGREWSLEINVNTLKRVKATGFDLLSVIEDRDALLRLGTDPELMVDTLYAICQPQAEKLSIDGTAFAEGLGGGDVLQSACDAMLESIADFFPKHRREPMQKALMKLRQVQDKAATVAMEKIESLDVEALVRQPPPMSGGSSTNAPGSSGLTLAQ